MIICGATRKESAKRIGARENGQWVWIVQKIRIARECCCMQGKGRKRPVAGQARVVVCSKKIVGAGRNRERVWASWLAGKVGGGLVAILGAIGLSVHRTLLVCTAYSRMRK